MISKTSKYQENRVGHVQVQHILYQESRLKHVWAHFCWNDNLFKVWQTSKVMGIQSINSINIAKGGLLISWLKSFVFRKGILI